MRWYGLFDDDSDDLVWECERRGASSWAAWVADDARSVVLHADDTLVLFAGNGTPAPPLDLLSYLEKDPLSRPHIIRSTAGRIWEKHKPQGYLYRYRGLLFLCLETNWGKRVVLDMDHGCFIVPDEGFLDEMLSAEGDQKPAYESRLRYPAMEPPTDPWWKWPLFSLRVLGGAALVAGIGWTWWRFGLWIGLGVWFGSMVLLSILLSLARAALGLTCKTRVRQGPGYHEESPPATDSQDGQDLENEP